MPREELVRPAEPLSFTVARVALVATLFASPWAFGGVQSWAWASLAVIASCLLILWAWGSVQQGAMKIAWTPIYVPASFFLLTGIVQHVVGRTLDPIASREALLKLATDLAFFFLAGQLLTTASPGTWRSFGLLVTILGFALGLFSILQMFSSQGQIYWSVKTEGGSFGPYVNRNHYAGLVEMWIPISVAYVVSRRRNQSVRVALIFCVSVAAASLLLSGSRGGLLASFIGSLIAFGMLGCHRRGMSGGKVGLIGGVGILFALALFFWLDGGRLAGRLAPLFSPNGAQEVGLVQRAVVAAESLRILREHPWVGLGLGSFEIAYARVRSFPSDLVWDHAHNDFAEALVETGVLGGVLMSVALGLFFHAALRGFPQRIGSETGKVQVGAAVSCCVLLVHSLFDFNLRIPANAAWFAVSAAAATIWLRSPRKRDPFLSGPSLGNELASEFSPEEVREPCPLSIKFLNFQDSQATKSKGGSDL